METGREATGYYKWKSIDRYAAQPPCKNKFPWIPIDPACREENSTAFIVDIMKALKRKKKDRDNHDVIAGLLQLIEVETQRNCLD